MAKDLGVSSSYLSALEHGKKPISESFVKKIYVYFRKQQVTMQEWAKLAADSQPQMKLDLSGDRDTKLAFGRKFDGLSEAKKNAIRKILNADEESA